MESLKRDLKTCTISASTIILDIEGTTTSISFVKDILFPYIRSNLEKFLNENWGSNKLQEHIKALRTQAQQDEENKVEGVIAIPEEGEDNTLKAALLDNIKWQMDNDRKTKSLKDLQGLIMEEGYKAGDLKGHLYDDVERSLKTWSDQNKSIYIYSSGSVHAQKLLFGNSEKGDMLPFIKGHFDTNVGMKGDSNSYTEILKQISISSSEAAFFTDVPTEARAAKEAGIQAILVSREGNGPLSDQDKSEFQVITSFEDVEFENCKKMKICAESLVTVGNKQIENCSVSIEDREKPDPISQNCIESEKPCNNEKICNGISNSDELMDVDDTIDEKNNTCDTKINGNTKEEDSSTESKKEESTDAKEEESTDTKKEESTDTKKEESTETMPKESTDSNKEQSTETMKEELTDSKKEELTETMKEESTNSKKDELIETMKEEPTDSKKEELTETMKVESVENKQEKSTEIMKEEKSDSLNEESTETIKEESVESKQEKSIEIMEEEVTDSLKEESVEDMQENSAEINKEESIQSKSLNKDSMEMKESPVESMIEELAEVKEEEPNENVKENSTENMQVESNESKMEEPIQNKMEVENEDNKEELTNSMKEKSAEIIEEEILKEESLDIKENLAESKKEELNDNIKQNPSELGERKEDESTQNKMEVTIEEKKEVSLVSIKEGSAENVSTESLKEETTERNDEEAINTNVEITKSNSEDPATCIDVIENNENVAFTGTEKKYDINPISDSKPSSLNENPAVIIPENNRIENGEVENQDQNLTTNDDKKASSTKSDLSNNEESIEFKNKNSHDDTSCGLTEDKKHNENSDEKKINANNHCTTDICDKKQSEEMETVVEESQKGDCIATNGFEESNKNNDSEKSSCVENRSSSEAHDENLKSSSQMINGESKTTNGFSAPELIKDNGCTEEASVESKKCESSESTSLESVVEA